MNNLLNPIVLAAKHYPAHLARHLVWWLRLSRVSLGEGTTFHLPVKISGSGTQRFGKNCIVESNVTFACVPGSGIEFGHGCSVGAGASIYTQAGCVARFKDDTRILPNSELVIGAKWEIGTGSAIESNCRISSREHGYAGDFVVGDFSVIGDYSLIDTTGGVTIGEGVAIGPYCVIYTHDHEPEASKGAWQGPVKVAPVRIGNGAWVGARVTILPGVSIGERAIIGAGAVVTGDVPAGALAIGVPARVQAGSGLDHLPRGELRA